MFYQQGSEFAQSILQVPENFLVKASSEEQCGLTFKNRGAESEELVWRAGAGEEED